MNDENLCISNHGAEVDVALVSSPHLCSQFSKDIRRRFFEPIDEDRTVNEWGWIVSRKVSCGYESLSEFYLGGYLDTPEKYENFSRPDPHDPWRARNWIEAKKSAGDDIFLIPLVGGIFDLSLHGIGLKNYLLYMHQKPSFIEKVLKDDANFCIELAKILIDEGAEAIGVYSDMGEKSGPFFSPAMARKLIYLIGFFHHSRTQQFRFV